MEMQSAEIGELAKALQKVQASMKPAIKDTVNPFFGKTYADLASVWEAVRGPLSENGLAVAQGVSTGEPNVLWTQLMHSSGQWLRSECPLLLAKTDPQGVGSAITYYRRYSLAAMLGVVQEDDDANSAMPKMQIQAPKIAPAQPAPGPVHHTPEGKAPEDIDFDPGKPDVPASAQPVGVDWKIHFKLTPEEKAAWHSQGWKSEKRISKASGKEFEWVAVPKDFDPAAYPVPAPIDQPEAPKAEEKAPDEGGKAVDAVALASALQTAESRAALGVAWEVVLKVQKKLSAKVLTDLAKMKREKEASLPA